MQSVEREEMQQPSAVLHAGCRRCTASCVFVNVMRGMQKGPFPAAPREWKYQTLAAVGKGLMAPDCLLWRAERSSRAPEGAWKPVKAKAQDKQDETTHSQRTRGVTPGAWR